MDSNKVIGKTVIVDDTGRITIPIKYRNNRKIQLGDKVVIKEVGDLLVITTQNDFKKTLSFEYLYNKITKSEQTVLELNEKIEELREMLISLMVENKK